MSIPKIQIRRESKLVQGHVLDVSRAPLLAALKRYDAQLYLRWRPAKGEEPGVWELRRKPELKSVKEGRYLDTPHRGRVFFPGDVFHFDDFTITVPKYHETSADCVKTFSHLGYHIVEWVGQQDLWKYGYKGSKFIDESDYNLDKYLDRVEKEADDERNYMLKDMRTQINDFREYVLSGGNPYRLLDYWNK